MKVRACPWESELTQALRSGHWPEACGPELRTHVSACADCRDLVLVTDGFRQARTATALTVPAGSPGLLWWRAELRRRRQAAEQIAQPITFAQTFACIVSLLAAVAFLASQYRYGLRWGSWWSEFSAFRPARLWSAAGPASEWNLLLLIPVFGLFVLLGGIVLYLVRERE